LASHLDATSKRRMSGSLSIGRWYFHSSSWTTLFPCPAAAKFTDGQSLESRSTLVRQSSSQATRAASLASAWSLQALTTAKHLVLKGFFRSINAGLSSRQARQSPICSTFFPQAIASSMKAAYSVFETTGPLPTSYSDRDLKSLQEMLAQFYGLVNSTVLDRSERHRIVVNRTRLRTATPELLLSTLSP